MFEELDGNVDALNDPRAGALARRDAAENLGKIVQRALYALRTHAQDADEDVRRSVVSALDRSGAPPDAGDAAVMAPAAKPKAHAAAAKPPGHERHYTIEELVRGCAKAPKRTVARKGEGFEVTVQLEGGRSQKVYILPFKRHDGEALIRVHTYCGDVVNAVEPWALKNNMKLTYCAFGLHEEGELKRLALVSNFVHGKTTPETICETVKAIGYYGDWFERRISGKDEF